MSTRYKLITLVIFTCLANGSSLVINELMTRPVRIIEAEQSTLDTLEDRLLLYTGQINRLDSESFTDQLLRVGDAKSGLDDAFNAVAGVELLPDLNPSVQVSLENIVVFQEDIEKAHASLVRQSGLIRESASTIIGSDKPFTVDQLDAAAGEEDSEVKARIEKLSSIAFVVNGTIDNAQNIMTTQKRLIDDEILVLENRATRAVVSIIAAVLVSSLTIALIIANLMAGRIKRIEIGIARMRDGDLADRIDVRSRDELGRLSGNVNDFTDALGRSMLRVKQTSGDNLTIKDNLITGVNRMLEATETVEDSVQNVAENMDNLDETVRSTTDTVQLVRDRLDRLDGALEDQVAMIDQTNAAMAQMIASIDNVGEITARKKDAMGQLVNLSREGGTKLGKTNEVISRVHDSIEEIRGTAGIIASIASRTNLLAMNAAIEAAHAGNVGRGFAVVADEIRKLAEATASNSKNIDGVIASVIANIEEAADSGKTTSEVFGSIDKEVAEATESFGEIAGSMGELAAGGKQILDAMARLNDLTGHVRDDRVAMNQAAQANKQAFGEVGRISSEAAVRMKEIVEILQTLKGEMEAVSSVTQKVDRISETLESEVAVFKIGVHSDYHSPS